MKKTILLILFLAQFCNRIEAQDFWKTLPFPDSIDVACLAVNSQGDIFVGSAQQYVTNGIFRSTDSGQTWTMVLNTANFQIYSIAINEFGHIYASIGGFDLFRASYDNGNSWNNINLPINGGISKIYCINQDTLMLGSGLNDGAILLRSPDRGITWDTLFMTENHTSEFVSDIAISGNGDIYISLMCYFPDMGGVYKSTDNGNSWEFVGLLSHQVMDVEINSFGDVFIGVFCDFDIGGGGIYALYHDSLEIHECLFGPFINGLVVNSANDIYAGSGMPDGIIQSLDIGLTFEFQNSGLPPGPKGKLFKDSKDYIYALPDAPSNRIYRTVEPTFTSIYDIFRKNSNAQIEICPNPVHEILQGFLPLAKISNDEHFITLIEPSGKILIHKLIDLKENSFQINVNFLKPGLYFLIIDDGYSSYYAKIVKI